MTFITGQAVSMTFAGVTVAAEVALASSNGHSLMLRFDAALGHEGLYVGMMPILLGTDGAFYDLIEGMPVMLEDAAA